MKQNLLFLGVIKFSKQQFLDLPFLAKLEFLSKWLNPERAILSQKQYSKISADQPKIDEMLKGWEYVSRKMNLQRRSSELQSFRIKLEKSLIESLGHITNDKDKLRHAQMLKEVVSTAGFYQDTNPITTPDPQFVKKVNNHLQAQRVIVLDRYKKAFEGFGLRLKASLVKLFSYKKLLFLNATTNKKKWVNKVTAQLSQLNDKKMKQHFLESIFSSYESDVQKGYISAPKKALFKQWNLNPQDALRPHTAIRKLFLEPINSTSSVEADDLFESTKDQDLETFNRYK